MPDDTCTLGRTVIIKGELKADEDLIVEGQVEGRIDLPHHLLTIGPHATIQGEVRANVLRVLGTVKGDAEAVESISIRNTATVEGTLVAPRVGMAPGASFLGRIDMRPPGTSKGLKAKSEKLGIMTPPVDYGA